MKQLQNNFTTPEQSKRLLELGVPAWSADCEFYEEGVFSENDIPDVLAFDEHYEESSNQDVFCNWKSLPCWSVGRLREIIDICDISEVKDEWPRTEELVENFGSVTEYLVLTIEFMRDKLDFSKLDE